MQNIPHLKWIGIVVGSFLLPLTFASAQSCGDFIFTYDFGGELIVEREPVEDCANPFGETDGPESYIPTVTLNGTQVGNDEHVLVTELPVTQSVSIVNSLPDYFLTASLVRHEGEDFRYIDQFVSDTITFTATGTYTIIATYFEPPVLAQTKSRWQKIAAFLVPTVFAQFPEELFYEVYATTFTVDMVPVEPPVPTGASSVLFLPGIQASRLYTEGALGTENRLWEPNINADVIKLAMTESGESVNDVYTRDVLDEVYGVINVYEGFLRFLDGLIADDVIQDWKPYAYDWRYDVFDIVENGSVYKSSVNGEPQVIYLVEVLEELAATSKSGKVTIVAHSNGGLLAKALMIQLEAEGRANLVDNVVFVGSPQLGTPKAVASVLHGYGQALLGGLLVSDETSRRSVVNMPGAYGLLPSKMYVDTADDPVVMFDESPSTVLFEEKYGESINSHGELLDFLVGAEGREKAEDVTQAELLNPTFVQQSSDYHDVQLDSWVAPAGTEVIEVVGVGLDTERGFHYKEFKERVCDESDIFGTSNCIVETLYKPVPLMSQSGDGTVVDISAEGYQGDKSTYYLDLKLIKSDLDMTIKHVNLTEFNLLQTFILQVLDDDKGNIEFLSETKPAFTESRYMLGVHSPVTITVTDSEGHQVGVLDGNLTEDIPGSSYREIADSKYIIVPKNTDIEVLIEGETEGGMTLTVHELEEGSQSEKVYIPIEVISSSTRVRFDIYDSNISNIKVDSNGDEVVDLEFTPEGEEVGGDAKASYGALKAKIEDLSLRRVYERSLLRKVSIAHRLSKKSKSSLHIKRVEVVLLRSLRWQLRLYNRKNVIDDYQYEELKSIIDSLLNT
jgi:pimeloyl-ACP methyl ester carboxylesterase